MAEENQKLLALNLVAAATLALLGFLLARPFTDEGIFLTGGWLTSQGLLPYQDFFDIHNPGIFFLLAPVYQVIGPNLIASRILVILVQAATLLALYTLTRRMFDHHTALLATAIHAAWLPVFYGFQLTIEPFSTFASTLAVLAFHRVALEGKRRATDVLLLGAVLGLAFLFKQTMLLLAVGLLAVFVWHLVATRGTRSLLSKKAGLLLVALLALPLAIFGIYTLRGAGQELGWQTWGYNLSHAGILSNTAFKVEYAIVPVLLLFFTPLGLVWAARKGFHPEDPRFWERVLLFAWLVLSLPNVFPLVGCCHHFMPLSPAAAVVSAGVVMKLLSGDKRSLLAGAVGVLLLMAGLSMYVGLNHFGKDEFKPAQEIAAFVKENSAPQDSLMVFHHNVEIYFLSVRKPATRYLYYPYLFPEEFQEFQQELRGQLESNPPKLVVDFSGNGEPLNPDGKAEAEQWVLDNYEKIKEFRFDPPYNDYYHYAFVYQRKG